MKDLTLTNQVPLLKRILEKFVLEVKAIFTGKGCVEAFWIGNLKNRDLKVSQGNNSLPPGRCGGNFKSVISKQVTY